MFEFTHINIMHTSIVSEMSQMRAEGKPEVLGELYNSLQVLRL
jgi:hypothetical protein